MVFYVGNSKTYSFEGNLNNGIYNYSLTGNSGTFTFNLLPNPYPSSINWGYASGWVKSAGIGGTCYVWNPTSGNYTSLSSATDSYIPAGQAFMVLVDNEDSPSISVTNTARSHNSQAFYKSTNDRTKTLMVKASSNGYSDQTEISFTEAATTGFDLYSDGLKFSGLKDAPQLYTISEDQHFSINQLPSFQNEFTIPLYFETEYTGPVMLSFEGNDTFDLSNGIWMKDVITGDIINLRTQGNYVFDHHKGNPSDRFLLKFGETGFETTADETLNIWISGNQLFILAPELTGEKATIEIFNTSGQLVQIKQTYLSELTTIKIEFRGMAVVKVTTPIKGMVTKGVFLNE